MMMVRMMNLSTERADGNSKSDGEADTMQGDLWQKMLTGMKGIKGILGISTTHIKAMKANLPQGTQGFAG